MCNAWFCRLTCKPFKHDVRFYWLICEPCSNATFYWLALNHTHMLQCLQVFQVELKLKTCCNVSIAIFRFLLFSLKPNPCFTVSIEMFRVLLVNLKPNACYNVSIMMHPHARFYWLTLNHFKH